MGNKNKKSKLALRVGGLGIRTQLVMGFTLFIVMILLIVWIFQVLLLDYFYEKTKISEMNEVLDGIESSIDDSELDKICEDLASQYDVCISVYGISNGSIDYLKINKEVSPTCVIHYADESLLNSYYRQALSNGGTYSERSPLMPGGYTDSYHPDQDFDNNDYRRVNRDNMFVVAVSVKAMKDSAGTDFAVFINLRFTPVRAIEQTRSLQFVYIAGVVIVATILFALIYSGKIARPLEKMTESAERMAAGDYSADFDVEGCRETQRLAETLNYAIDEISQTDAIRRELIANVSHDLRTPLTLISGYSEMMRDIPGENTPENSQLIIDETRRLTTLVNDMLDFSKYSSGFEVPDLKVFNLTESVRKSMSRYNELIRQQGYRIDFMAEYDVLVSADERMIIQVIYNLLNNAVNYTGEDKVIIISQTASNPGKVRISISDTGCGIAEENISKIWDRYYKIDKTHKRPVTGSGLGLSIVSRLLQLHKASYGVESTNGSGSTFWFELNIVED